MTSLSFPSPSMEKMAMTSSTLMYSFSTLEARKIDASLHTDTRGIGHHQHPTATGLHARQRAAVSSEQVVVAVESFSGQLLLT